MVYQVWVLFTNLGCGLGGWKDKAVRAGNGRDVPIACTHEKNGHYSIPLMDLWTECLSCVCAEILSLPKERNNWDMMAG